MEAIMLGKADMNTCSRSFVLNLKLINKPKIIPLAQVYYALSTNALV